MANRFGDTWAFARVLKEHAGEEVAIPQSQTKCKLETA
jgi:hypothetical protein